MQVLTFFAFLDLQRTELGVFVDDMKHRVKRLCICGGPRHVRLNVTRKMKSTMNNNLGSLHRVDIYNISGYLFTTFTTYFLCNDGF